MEKTSPTLTWRGALFGAKLCFPIGVFSLVFGVAFGAIAAEKGIASFQAVMLSFITFAGTSQFVAMDFWTHPINMAAMFLAVFAISARHVLMSAALYPWIKHYPYYWRFISAAFLSDPNWAFSLKEFEKGNRDFGIFLGGGFVLWIPWFVGTYFGVAFGRLIHDSKALGIDTFIVTFFACFLISLWKDKTRSMLPWLVAGLAAMLGYFVLPTGWHIMAGGLAGGIVGFVTYKAEASDD
ncbi:AzlC family ABC transporter permease [Alphaproteobacteria bacterium]|nr:AzlC family ABC transporter permease [Alphaproteobacteria bacterium]